MMVEQIEFWSYPPVGAVAVMDDGARIMIWPEEGNSPEAFTGQHLAQYENDASMRVHGISCMWDRAKISRIENPTDRDLALSWIYFA